MKWLLLKTGLYRLLPVSLVGILFLQEPDEADMRWAQKQLEERAIPTPTRDK